MLRVLSSLGLIMNEGGINPIILKSDSFSEAFSGLFSLKRNKSPLSLQSLANKLQYKSKGHISAILKGEKRLPLKKCEILKSVFSLNDYEFSLLYLLCSLDHSNSPNEKKVIRSQIRITQDHFSTSFLTALPKDLNECDFALIYCCIGLIKKEGFTIKDIEELTDLPQDTIHLALKTLIEFNSVAKDQNQTYQLISSHLRIPSQYSDFALSMTRALINEGSKRVEEHFSNKDLAFFENSMVSVLEKDYKSFIEKLRLFIHSELTQIESSEGDLIILTNFNSLPYKRI
tara:strand:- start:114198 stop:115058 length:861 start_codon:yes stop_codon:yes gene_type:complete